MNSDMLDKNEDPYLDLSTFDLESAYILANDGKADGRRGIRSVGIVGFLKGLCNPPEVSSVHIANKGCRWAVISVVGIVTGYDSALARSVKYSALSGNILTLLPEYFYSPMLKLKSQGFKPFLFLGGHLNKDIRNKNIWKMACLTRPNYEKVWSAYPPSILHRITSCSSDGVISYNWRAKINNIRYLDLSVYKQCVERVIKDGYKDLILDGVIHPSLNVNWFFDGYDDSLDGIEEYGKRKAELNQKPEVGGIPDTCNHLGEAAKTVGVSENADWGSYVVEDNKLTTKIESRNKLKDRSERAEILHNKVIDSRNKINDLLINMKKCDKKYSINRAIAFTAERLKLSWRSKNGGSRTGSDLFFEAIRRVDESMVADGRNSIIGMYITSEGSNILDYWVNPIDDNNSVYKFLKTNKEQIYYGILEVCLGISGLVNASRMQGSFDLYSLLCENPYYLCLIDARLTIQSLDILAMLYNANKKREDVIKLRNVAFIHNAFICSDSILNGSTVISKQTLNKKLNMQYAIGAYVRNNLLNCNCIYNDAKFLDIKNYIHSGIVKQQLAYPPESLSMGDTWYYRVTVDKAKAIQDYLDSGVGIQIDVGDKIYYTDYNLAKKEDYIYNRLYQLCEYQNDINLTDEEFDNVIQSFEDMKIKEGLKDFKLEPLQRDSVKLLNNNIVCLTGPAGSGKTTTAEAILYANQKLLGVGDKNILFVAPTGKAANRLREVVKRTTGTIHSRFRIMGDESSLKEDEDDNKALNLKDIDLLIVDESSMLTIDLLYTMLHKVKDGVRIYFLGDIEQLPPIGFGKPFINMLSFLPCVQLEVSKRAAEDSLINFNAKTIINNSKRGTEFRPLKEGDDFKLIPCRLDDTSKVIHDLVEWHLGLSKPTFISDSYLIKSLQDMNADDIQIVTPYSAKSKATSTFNINNLVKDSFNPLLKTQKVYKVFLDKDRDKCLELKVGDRVINTKNNPDRRGFISTPSGLKCVARGVMNGDVGKIKSFLYADDLVFAPNSKDIESEFKGSDMTLFIGVEFDFIDSNGDSSKCTYFYRTQELTTVGREVTLVYSSDLKVLDLAYALTVHKIQGSQADLVIFVVAGGTANFISRNLIYTAITRAKKGCYIIGDVQGNQSLISLGRLNEIANSRETIMDTF